MYGFSRNDLGRFDVPQVVPSPTLQQVGWVPTNEKEAESWALEQAEKWAAPKAQKLIGDAANRVKHELAMDIELAVPMSDDETVNWAVDYLTHQGVPRSPEDAARMMRRFLDEQGTSLGIHPAFVVASDLLIDFPLDDPEQALEWTWDVGRGFAEGFGIPMADDLDAKSIVTTSATAGLTHAGVPFAGALTVTASALFDGQVTQDELRSLAGMVGSMVGATIGQMFGIPAPIGGFIGSVVTTLIFDGLGKLFGWGPDASTLRAQALYAARMAAEAKETQCIMMGSQAWTQYQNYWYELVGKLQESINAESFWLQHGLRYFENAYVEEVEVDPSQCKWVNLRTFKIEEKDPCFQKLPAVIDRSCDKVEGCLYFGQYNQNPGLWLRHDARGWLGGAPGHTHPDAKPDVEYRYVQDGAMIDHKLSARAALLNYGAYEFVTPYQAYRTFVLLEDYSAGSSQLALLAPGGSERVGMGKRVRDFESTLQTDRRYIEALSHVPIVRGNEFGGKYALGDCDTQRWAAQLFESLLQCGPATGLISRDIAATISAAMVEYKIAAASREESVQQQAARAAQARNDLLHMRRTKQHNTRALNGGLLAGGGGALAGWALSSILGKR